MKQIQEDIRYILDKYYSSEKKKDQIVSDISDSLIYFGERVRKEQHNKTKDMVVEAVRELSPNRGLYNQIVKKIKYYQK